MRKLTLKIRMVIPMLMLALCFACSFCSTVHAKGTDVQTRKYNTNEDINNMKSNSIWETCKDAILAFQEEINLIVNCLVGIFVMIGGIVFIINCIRLCTIESHPLARKQEYISMLITVGTIAGLGGIFFFGKLILFAALGV